ncbi:transcriptional regulator with GAF, ATPase, and Fis domain [Desulfobaculum xiamenense]|uniref:Transcriptional regulator with GAF, ATPase, and Fis domain n=1 Tax=Desulfobaculum xiamenense TaxID=995050 RepID=A0A846QPU6_9BACT|nr:sigma 54-interacting transcriptional regulator [Desulfobaculum xiamenense]NJB68343.1 transcriptional regulator with GAF, ATPase, and Fis domain [Desulfobaculum xiamenense]
MDPRDFFHHATLRICGSLDIDKALYDCWSFLRSTIPADGMYINLYMPERRAIRFIARADAAGPEIMDAQVCITPDMCATLESPNRPRVRIIGDIRTDPVTHRVARSIVDDDSSVILLRLMIDNRHLGVVGMHAHGRHRYTQEHADLLGMLHEPFAIATANALRHRSLLDTNSRLSRENRQLREQLGSSSRCSTIIGIDSGLRDVMTRVTQVAPLSSTVLLLGETGVGKEVVACAVHESSPRKNGPFVKVNCGAIPESLMDSELFGHEKGAFTGADASKKGVFEQAHGGTLFLDEIGELPLAVQVRLLRVLQTHTLVRVGGQTPREVDIRIIAATHRDLATMVREGNFREDLWFRLNVFPITIPTLRERRDDIPELAAWFAARAARRLGTGSLPEIPCDEMARLKAYHWPGNVRELENCVERAIILSGGRVLRFDWLSCPPHEHLPAEHPVAHADQTLDEAMRRHIEATIDAAGGKIHGPGGAAERLGVNPSTLRSKMNKLGIQYGRH